MWTAPGIDVAHARGMIPAPARDVEITGDRCEKHRGAMSTVLEIDVNLAGGKVTAPGDDGVGAGVRCGGHRKQLFTR